MILGGKSKTVLNLFTCILDHLINNQIINYFSHHLSAAAADSVYDKLRMFNGQAAAAAGWAWYGKSNFFFITV